SRWEPVRGSTRTIAPLPSTASASAAIGSPCCAIKKPTGSVSRPPAVTVQPDPVSGSMDTIDAAPTSVTSKFPRDGEHVHAETGWRATKTRTPSGVTFRPRHPVRPSVVIVLPSPEKEVEQGSYQRG